MNGLQTNVCTGLACEGGVRDNCGDPRKRFVVPSADGATMPYTVVSLFSGGGGLDYGLALAGFQTRLAVEWERYACQSLRDAKALRVPMGDSYHYLDGCEVVESDIAVVGDAESLELARLAPGEATLLVGGPPCVTFSVAGRREGLTSETGLLYKHYIRMLRAFSPEGFIFENVKGMLTAQAGTDDPRPAIDVICEELRAAGYALTMRVIDAADYGVPQHRRRVIILGRRGSRPFDFPEPTHAHPNRLGLFSGSIPWATVADAFAGLPPAVLLGDEPLLRNHVAKRHGERIRASYAETAPGARNRASMRDRLRWDVPGTTVRAQGKPKADGSGQKNSSHQAIHPEEPRQLTPRECARIQTFPDWYPFPAQLVNAYRVIGDAVPPLLARVIGNAIRRQLDADRMRDDAALLGAVAD